jgi:hypothetical protein
VTATEWLTRFRAFVAERRRMRRRARVALGNAVRDGRVSRSAYCDACGAHDERLGPWWLEAHHDDYTAPLAVRWLCVPCHRAEHVRAPSLVREFQRTIGRV